jgi:hypothetical protein
MAIFKIDGNSLHFFVDIDSHGIAIVLKHHLYMFGNFMSFNVMVMKEDDNNFAHF